MKSRLLVYGAGGFTGRLIVEEALARGLSPIVAGRREAALIELSHTHLLDRRVAALEDQAALATMLENVSVVLNAAGPFRATSQRLADACVRAGAHYLDISGEHDTFANLRALDEKARRRGSLILPGVGFDIVPSDCLTALVATRLPGARSLSLALTGLELISRGSALTVLERLAEPVLVRREGKLVEARPLTVSRSFDFGKGAREATAVTWADLGTAHHTSGIPNVTVFYEATPIIRLGLGMKTYGSLLANAPLQSFLETLTRAGIPGGPSAVERARGGATVIALAEDETGRTAGARLHTPEVYSFTAQTSLAIAERVLSGNFRPGFHTPGTLLGPHFASSLPGVTFSELS